MWKSVLCFAVCIALGCSYPLYDDARYWGQYYGGYPGYLGYPGFYPYWYYPAAPTEKLAYYGPYQGSCEGAADGLYYVDSRSFAFCSGGQLTLQPCADGAANPHPGSFSRGAYYGLSEFCSINLLAHGYQPSQLTRPHDRPQRRPEAPHSKEQH